MFFVNLYCRCDGICKQSKVFFPKKGKLGKTIIIKIGKGQNSWELADNVVEKSLLFCYNELRYVWTLMNMILFGKENSNYDKEHFNRC